MKDEDRTRSVSAPGKSDLPGAQDVAAQWRRVVRRRSFLHGIGVAGAAMAGNRLARADSRKLPKGDADILRLLAAAELIESDLWSQYAELGGVNGGNPAYMTALTNLDSDMPQYITDNTDDELSHAAFLNAYLASKGEKGVDLSGFLLPLGSPATGASQVGRLTNLKQLDVDTSWWTRYRSVDNIDVNPHANFPQAVTINNQPAIPISDKDTDPVKSAPPVPFGGVVTTQQTRMQAIANAAGFHFAFIEQGGSSLYPTMALKVTDLEVLRIVLSIGGVEIDHFAVWHDKAGNIVPLTDPETGTVFPDLNGAPFNTMGQPNTPPGDNDNLFQTNLILPEPAVFLSSSLPPVSIIRPVSTANSGAVAAIQSFVNDNLFMGQSGGFLETVMGLAVKADAAKREAGHDD
jgi:hypothetical protein